MTDQVQQSAAACCKSCGFYVLSFLAVIILVLYLTGYDKILRTKFRKVVLAALLNKGVEKHNHALGEHKQRLFGPLENDAAKKTGGLKVLEIGAGAGANFKYYPPGTSVICVDPNEVCESYLRKNHSEFGDKVTLKEFRITGAEDLSGVESGSIDAVVSTMVLCSVVDVDQSLKEVIRVLKPGGKFYFLEHIILEESSPSYKLQQRLAPVIFFLMGSRINQDAKSFIDRAGFSHVESETFTAPGHGHGHDHGHQHGHHSSRIFGPLMKVSSRLLMGTATK
jgi:ubiquinone/menaquinone biosynthesis C-methylase UbiE